MWQSLGLVLIVSSISLASETRSQEMGAVRARIILQSSFAAGLRHHDAKAVWNDLRVGDGLTLVRETDNSHDFNAVRVEWNNRILGYLPKSENTFVARHLDRGKVLVARIASLGLYRNHRRKLGIEIYVWL